MSDSEAEFESANEGSKGDDGWEIDCDFDLPDVQQLSVRSSAYPEENVKTCKRTDVEPPEKDSTVDAIPMIQSRLDKLAVSNNSQPHISEESKVVQNEIKSPTTPSSVSENDYISNIYYFQRT